MQKKRLIIVTGAYGKTGKTSFSIVNGLYYMTKGFNVTFLECNDNNADIDKVFDFYHIKNESKVEGKNGFEIITKTHTVDSNKSFDIIIPNRQTHSHRSVIAFAKLVIAKFNNRKIFVVDTNQHIGSTLQLQDMKETPNLNDLKKLKAEGFEIMFYHFWDFGSISYKKDLDRTKQAVEMLEKLGVRVIHIFSAHMLQIVTLLGLKAGKQGKKSLAKVQNIFKQYWKDKKGSQLQLMPYTVIHSVLRIASAKAYALKGKKEDEIGREFPRIWESAFANLLHFTTKLYNNENVKPANLILIPYINDILQIVEKICITGIRDNKGLRTAFGEYYVVIERSLIGLEDILIEQGG